MIAPLLTTDKHTHELTELKQAFEMFIRETDTLRTAYGELKQQVASINMELEDTNRELNTKVSELNSTQHFINNVLENIGTGVIAIDSTGQIKTCNSFAERILEVEPGFFTSRHYMDAFDNEEWRTFKEFLTDSFSSGHSYTSKSVSVFSANGDNIPVELNVSIILDTKTGNHIGAVLTFKDLRKIKRLEDQVRQSQTLAAIGEMAAHMAHEIRNPLGGIEGFSTLLSRDLKDRSDTADQYRIATDILEGVQSLKRFVSSLLTFAKPITPEPVPTDVGELLDKTAVLAQIKLMDTPKRKVELTTDADMKLLPVMIDKDLMGQALLNLVLNAVEALPEDKPDARIKISATLHKKSKDFWKNIPQANANSKLNNLVHKSASYFFNSPGDSSVQIAVSDNGCGIPEDMVGKLFNPFNTSKESGTGLGLSMVYKIIEAHNGFIHFTTQKDKGTTFYIDIPLSSRLENTVCAHREKEVRI